MTAPTGHPTSRRAALGVVAAAGLAAGAQPGGARSAGGRAVGHVVLLGDSVFDNAGYLRGGPDVVAQLRAPAGRLAGDAFGQRRLRRRRVPGQLERLPPGATHLVVSAGGNDAGRREGVLGEPARGVAEGLARIADAREGFARDYRAMLEAVLGRGLPAAVCTIYDPRFPDPGRRRVAVVALAAFNDAITRGAFARGVSLLDLRLVCDRDEDFAAPTGPSERGGAKIAAAIATWATGHGPARRRSEVFAGGG